MKKELKNLSFIIATHVYATGPSFKLENYLKGKVKELVFIGHPFSFASDRRSFIRIYKKGNLILEKKFVSWKGSDSLFYLKDILLTLWWCFKYGGNTDYFVGVNNFNAVSGYIMKLFGRVQKIIFYTIDYIPQRFENNFLNSVYHFLDEFAIKKSDKVWNLSPIMVKEREKKGVDKKYREKQIVVPIGTDVHKKPLSSKKRDNYKIVFMGHLREGQGVEMLIDAMVDVVRKIPKAHLMVIGGGSLENSLKNQVKRLKLDTNVEFTGFVEEFSDVQSLLSDSYVAIAPYVDDSKTYTRYTDPGKPKDYLAAGIPVIITKVPQVALEIERNRCGVAISYRKKELIKAIIKLLEDKELSSSFRKNALKMAEKYRWDTIFNDAFLNTL